MATQTSQNPTGNTWELSLYELHRKPHEMVSDQSAIAVSPRSLHSELMCPICLDLMRNTQTTKECLHRFCQDCIITALRSGNKECPTCRKKLVSKRSLRPDPNFDKLIAKIYPNREELNVQQEKSGNRRGQPIHRRKRKADSPLLDGGEMPGLQQQEGKKMKPSEPSEDGSVTPPLSTDSSTSSDLELQLRPHPQEVELKDRSIKNLLTSSHCTISHLTRFISINLGNNGDEEPPEYSLHALMGDQYVSLPVSATLQQISDLWATGDKLSLYFKQADLSTNS